MIPTNSVHVNAAVVDATLAKLPRAGRKNWAAARAAPDDLIPLELERGIRHRRQRRERDGLVAGDLFLQLSDAPEVRSLWAIPTAAAMGR